MSAGAAMAQAERCSARFPALGTARVGRGAAAAAPPGAVVVVDMWFSRGRG
jgi:hypothetical protein